MFSIELENENGNIVDINDEVSYVVTGISGLNPPSATLFTRKSPTRKGSKHNGSTLDERIVIIHIKILGDIEKNRNALYSWCEPEQYVKIYYKNGVKGIYCEGHVTDCDVDLFTTNEVLSLAVTCEDPYLKDLQAIETAISVYLNEFTFPFSIELNEDVPISSIRDNNLTTILNTGAETGVKITVFCKGALSNLTLYDGKDISKKITIKYTFSTNTIIEIDTEASPKTVRAILPNGTNMNVMKYLDANPHWFTLKKGYNIIGHYSDSTSTAYDVTVSYRNKHLGV